MMVILIREIQVITLIFSALLFLYQAPVFADDSDPNLSSGSSSETGYTPNSSISLHDSTNPVVDTGEGYYIPGDQNFDPNTSVQAITAEEAERRRSTINNNLNYGPGSFD